MNSFEEKTINEVVAEYVAVRDELKEAKRVFTEFESEKKEEMQVMSMWLLEQSEKMGVESFRTSSGTAFKVTKTYARMGNWDTFIKFVSENQYWQMLEKRVAKLATLEVIEQTGLAPEEIGVEVGHELDIQVKRS